jgi:hypothetical protein
MGNGRARDRPLGRFAVSRPRRRALPLLLFGGTALLGGCKAVPQIAGVIGGAAAGGATASPAVGFAVGVATATATGYAQRWYGRSREHAEQQAIAATAGALPVGGEAPWHISHLVPIGDEHGDLKVAADIVNPLAPCRSVLFSVVDGSGPKAKRSWYQADICRRASGWQWASAEPAVPRWGYLQ